MYNLRNWTAPTYEDEQTMTPHQLVEANIPYAIQQGLKYWEDRKALARTHDSDDYVSAAVDGMLKASERFDKEKCVKFITYANWWIYQRLRVCETKDSVVSKPVNRTKDFRILLKESKNLGMSLYNTSLVLGWGLEKYTCAIAGKRGISMSEKFEGHASNQQQVVSDYIPAVTSEYDDTPDRIQEMLETLPPRQAEVLTRLYYGGETLEAIGQDWELSRERIRQIKATALASLKKRFNKIKDDLLVEDEGTEIVTYLGRHLV